MYILPGSSEHNIHELSTQRVQSSANAVEARRTRIQEQEECHIGRGRLRQRVGTSWLD